MSTLLRNKKSGRIMMMLFLLVLIFFFMYSICDKDQTVSVSENRKLASKPDFSFSSLYKGTYLTKVESYYSDTFPFRDQFMKVNNKIKKITSQFSSGSDNVVIVNTKKTGDDFGGQSLNDVKKAQEEKDSSSD